MDKDEEFTIILDEYVVIDPEDGFCFFWSASKIACQIFLKVNKSLHASLLHV